MLEWMYAPGSPYGDSVMALADGAFPLCFLGIRPLSSL
jgi:hypothetical protein